ncbi:MAG: hypothetical protein OEV78_12795 [Spirochaetia bacterium]|nr:hypothetical protein [Spirochaetia bacterium]
MDKAILIPLIVWAILTVVVVLKNTVSSSARVSAVIVIAVFGFIFKDDIMAMYYVKVIPYKVLLQGTFEYVFISLAVVWPATLYYTQFMTETDSSSVIIKLAIFSAIAGFGFLYFN